MAQPAPQRQQLIDLHGRAGQDKNAHGRMHGRRCAGSPAATTENGSRHNQRVIVTTLHQMKAAAEAHTLQSPALLIVGEQAERALKFGWFGAPAIDARQSVSLRAVA